MHTALKLADHIETEDTVGAALGFANGALGSIEATSASHLNFDAMVHFYGTHGSFRTTTGGCNEIAFLELDNEERTAQLGALLDAHREELQARNEAFGKSCYGNSHVQQIAEFIGAVREGRAPFITGAQARHAVDIVLAVYESQHIGRPVELAP
jgi:predicted dehydrogenase